MRPVSGLAILSLNPSLQMKLTDDYAAGNTDAHKSPVDERYRLVTSIMSRACGVARSRKPIGNLDFLEDQSLRILFPRVFLERCDLHPRGDSQSRRSARLLSKRFELCTLVTRADSLL